VPIDTPAMSAFHTTCRVIQEVDYLGKILRDGRSPGTEKRDSKREEKWSEQKFEEKFWYQITETDQKGRKTISLFNFHPITLELDKSIRQSCGYKNQRQNWRMSLRRGNWAKTRRKNTSRKGTWSWS
jgi:hypothetical protein